MILAARGIVVSYESIRDWSPRFGRMFANMLRWRRPQPGDKWFLDEVLIRIRGKMQYLWRAVDQDGYVLDILVQSRRDAKAAKRFFRKLLKGLQCIPRGIVTDKLRSYSFQRRHIVNLTTPRVVFPATAEPWHSMRTAPARMRRRFSANRHMQPRAAR